MKGSRKKIKEMGKKKSCNKNIHKKYMSNYDNLKKRKKEPFLQP